MKFFKIRLPISSLSSNEPKIAMPHFLVFLKQRKTAARASQGIPILPIFVKNSIILSSNGVCKSCRKYKKANSHFISKFSFLYNYLKVYHGYKNKSIKSKFCFFKESLYVVDIRSVIATTKKYKGMYDFAVEEGVFSAKTKLKLNYNYAKKHTNYAKFLILGVFYLYKKTAVSFH